MGKYSLKVRWIPFSISRSKLWFTSRAGRRCSIYQLW